MNGYELSIYSNIPFYAWFLLFLGIIGGFSILILNLCFNIGKKNYWILGAFILIFIQLEVLLLFIIKGYTFYDYADPVTHLGIIKDINIFNHIGEDNFYPIFHIWINSIENMTNIPSIIIMKYVPSFLSILLILFLYLLATVIFLNKKYVIFTIMFVSIPCIGYYLSAVPNGFSFIFFPLILFLYFKRATNDKRIEIKILLIMFLIVLPFSHPLTTIMLIIYFITIELSFKIYHHRKKDINKKYKFEIFPVLLISILFSWWLISFPIFKRNIYFFILWTKMELSPVTSQVITSFDKLGLSFFDRILLFIKLYGINILLIAFALIAIIQIFKSYYKKTNSNTNQEKILFSIIFCLFSSGFLILLFITTGDPNFQPIRSLTFIFLITLLLASYGAYNIFRKTKFYSPKKSIIIIIFFIFLLSASSINTIFSLYDSPYVFQPNRQVTDSHISGLNYFFNLKDPSVISVTLSSSSPWRFAQMIFGKKAADNRTDFNKYQAWTVVADHFGYLNNTYLGRTYQDDKYLIIEKVFMLSYTDLWTAINRYNKDDFIMLNYDPTVNKIFSNGNVDIRFINHNN